MMSTLVAVEFASEYLPLTKQRTVMTKITAGQKRRYGRHLPHLVCVLSTKVPIMGSLIASQTLAIAMKILIAMAGRKITL